MRASRLLAGAFLALLAACDSPPRDAIVPAPKQAEIVNYAVDERGIRKVATFEAEVLVLARKGYGGVFGDDMADYAPFDLAVAWGEGARAEVHGAVDVRQSNRFYHWRASADAWQDSRVRRFGLHSANWHIIPADDAVADAMWPVRPGDVVRLKGFLVDIEAPDGRRWNTSRTRTDSGAGACEIFLVSKARLADG